ncbi:hypothetical protein GJAV_G00090260 [Gymnothorax javanicus]|nr:hypothetical protein GJAV_G00090260 [Gymnothorax javanicus]
MGEEFREENEMAALHGRRGGGAEKRQAADTGKKPKAPKKKKKKDPNEPQKPVSAYALFFRDTQASIKGQKPGATFGEVSKIVASTWDSLGEEEKQLYKKKTEVAKTEYLKQLAAYRASLVSQSRSPSSDVTAPESSNSPGPFPRSGQDCGVYPGLTHPQQAPAPLRLPGSKMESLMSFPRANMASQMSPHGANMASPMPLHRADTGLQRCLPGANMAASMPPSAATMAASSAPTQPMMQRCASLQHQQQFASHLGNQRPLSNHHQQLPLHLQSFASGFPPPAEFRGGMFNGFSAGGLALIPPMDYIQSGCRDSSTEGVDWSTDFSSNGSLLR